MSWENRSDTERDINEEHARSGVGRGAISLALWGGCVGWLISAICTVVFLKLYKGGAARPADLLLEAAAGSYTDETPEKVFFAGLFVLGSMFAYGIVRLCHRKRTPIHLLWLSVGLFILTISSFMKGVLVGSNGYVAPRTGSRCRGSGHVELSSARYLGIGSR